MLPVHPLEAKVSRAEPQEGRNLGPWATVAGSLSHTDTDLVE